jgi:hypothetical protein
LFAVVQLRAAASRAADAPAGCAAGPLAGRGELSIVSPVSDTAGTVGRAVVRAVVR